MSKLTKYEKETIILTSEGDEVYSIYTFNPALKRKLADFSRKYPDCCRITELGSEGSVTYEIKKERLSLRLVPPYSDERLKKMSSYAKEHGIHTR